MVLSNPLEKESFLSLRKIPSKRDIMTEENKKDDEKIKKEDAQIEIDWKDKFKKITKFTVKHSILIVLVFVLILQFMPNSEGKMPWGGMYMRGITEDMPQTEQWAKSSVESFYKNQLKQLVDKEYPNLPEANKQEVLTDKWEEFKTKNKGQIDQQIKVTREQFLNHFQYEHDGKK